MTEPTQGWVEKWRMVFADHVAWSATAETSEQHATARKGIEQSLTAIYREVYDEALAIEHPIAFRDGFRKGSEKARRETLEEMRLRILNSEDLYGQPVEILRGMKKYLAEQLEAEDEQIPTEAD
jgi:hypothetical protein